MNDAEIRKVVRERYAGVVNRSGGCCGSEPESCCGGESTTAEKISEEIGYSAEVAEGETGESVEEYAEAVLLSCLLCS